MRPFPLSMTSKPHYYLYEMADVRTVTKHLTNFSSTAQEWAVLQNFVGLTLKLAVILWKIFRRYYSDTVASIRNDSREFSIQSGVHQGYSEIPLLFCGFFDFVLTVLENRLLENFGEIGIQFQLSICSEACTRKLRSTGALHAQSKIF